MQVNDEVERSTVVNSTQEWQRRLQKLCAYGILVILILGPVFLGTYISIPDVADDGFVAFVLNNYAVFFILPYVGFLAYFIVISVENTRGPVEIEIATTKIKGAGGPILFWVIVFVATASVIKMFWNGYPK